jgi:hypothetical protein
MLVFPALGAFIMGSIIAETTQAEHIEHLVKPVKIYLQRYFRIGWYVYRSYFIHSCLAGYYTLLYHHLVNPSVLL